MGLRLLVRDTTRHDTKNIYSNIFCVASRRVTNLEAEAHFQILVSISLMTQTQIFVLCRVSLCHELRGGGPSSKFCVNKLNDTDTNIYVSRLFVS